MFFRNQIDSTGCRPATPGANAVGSFRGHTTLGPPTTGTFSIGDWIRDMTGQSYICTTTGTPGKWALAASGTLGEPLATGEEAPIRQFWNSDAVTVSSGTIRLSYFTARKTEAINSITIYSGNTAGLLATSQLFGVYAANANGDCTAKLAQGTASTSLLMTTFTAGTQILTSTFNKVAGTRYAIAFLGMSVLTMPTLCGEKLPIPALGAFPPIIGATKSGQTSLPTSITSVTPDNFIMGGVLLP